MRLLSPCFDGLETQNSLGRSTQNPVTVWTHMNSHEMMPQTLMIPDPGQEQSLSLGTHQTSGLQVSPARQLKSSLSAVEGSLTAGA
jgi:hypothetical protein